MKKFTIKATFNSYERRNNSIYGNPCYSVSFTGADGYFYTGKTASNAASAYIICDAVKGKTFNFTCHTTKKGALIVDYIREA